MAISTEGKIGIGLALGLAVAGAVSVVAPDWAKPIAWAVISLCGGGLIILGLHHELERWKLKGENRSARTWLAGHKLISTAAAVAIVVAAVLIGVRLLNGSPAERAEKMILAMVTKLGVKTGPSFHYFVRDDIEHTVNVTGTFDVAVNGAQGQTVYIVPFIIYYDLEKGQRYAHFYIPAIDKQPDANLVFEKVATQNKTSLEAFSAQVHLGEAPPGRGYLRSEDTTMSNRIAIYFENFMAQDELAKIALIFAQQGETVDYRGPDYAATRAAH